MAGSPSVVDSHPLCLFEAQKLKIDWISNDGDCQFEIYAKIWSSMSLFNSTKIER